MNDLKMTDPREIPQRFVEAWNSYDAHRIAELFVPDADFINVTGLWWENRQDIFKVHHYGLTVIFNRSTLKLTKTKVKYLAEDIAIVYAKTTLSDQTALDKDVVPQIRGNIFTFVVKREGGSWICYSAQNTEIQIGKETFISQADGSYEAVSYSKFKK